MRGTTVVTDMRPRHLLLASGLAALLGVALVLGTATTAVAGSILAPTGAADRVPVGLAVLGALLGVVGFAVRQWWARPGRGRRW
jgi:hypothetical protein